MVKATDKSSLTSGMVDPKEMGKLNDLKKVDRPELIKNTPAAIEVTVKETDDPNFYYKPNQGRNAKTTSSVNNASSNAKDITSKVKPEFFGEDDDENLWKIGMENMNSKNKSGRKMQNGMKLYIDETEWRPGFRPFVGEYIRQTEDAKKKIKADSETMENFSGNNDAETLDLVMDTWFNSEKLKREAAGRYKIEAAAKRREGRESGLDLYTEMFEDFKKEHYGIKKVEDEHELRHSDSSDGAVQGENMGNQVWSIFESLFAALSEFMFDYILQSPKFKAVQDIVNSIIGVFKVIIGGVAKILLAVFNGVLNLIIGLIKAFFGKIVSGLLKFFGINENFFSLLDIDFAEMVNDIGGTAKSGANTMMVASMDAITATLDENKGLNTIVNNVLGGIMTIYVFLLMIVIYDLFQ